MDVPRWLALAPVALALACQPVVAGEAGRYQERTPSRDGIGKVYLGREISHVMGHRGYRWLERPERVEEERPDQLIAALDLAPDDVVADVGAGSGYYSFRLAERVPEGRVLAVDIQPEMIAHLEAGMAARGIDHVEPVLGTLTDPSLPTKAVDLVLLVDAYHEFSHPFEMMSGIVASLAPGGRVVLVEYRAEDPEVPIKRLHKMSVRQAQKEMAAVGLKLVERFDGLPWQHVLIFGKAP